MKRLLLLPLIASLVWGVCACSHRADFFGRPSSPYHKLLSSMTRETRYFGLEKVEYFTRVTYRSRELREAYVDEYSLRYRLTDSEKAEMRASELGEADEFDVFLISHFATAEQGSRRRSLEETWNLFLSTDKDGGDRTRPVSVEPIPGRPDVRFTYFYPHLSRWATHYWVKFQRPSEGGQRHLNMTGVVADLWFTWK